MKKFINNVNDIVDEMIEGIVLANPQTLKRVGNFNVVTKLNINKNKVSIISGGGSGHEPAHAGFIGQGMIDAAVFGEIFTSPTPDQILAAIEEVATEKGVFLVVKNYTGDVLNFQMAAKMAKAKNIKVEMIVVDDDISLKNSTYTTGQRGIVGTVFVHKILGAAAESNKSLDDIKVLAEKLVKNIASYGISLDGCTIPANGKKGFSIPDDEMEVGLGIHGEPGVSKQKLKSANECVDLILKEIKSYLKLNSNSKIGLIINGKGATPLMELNILARHTIKTLKTEGVQVLKTFVGNYMTSIDMPGFSISIINLDKETERLMLFPALTNALVV